MATYEAVRTRTVEAGTAISLYRFIAEAADGAHDHSADWGDADGVSAEAQATVGGSLPMALMDGSVMKVEAAAAISKLDTVSSDASGKAKTHVTTIGRWRLGKALDAAAADGDIIRVQLHRELDEA